MRSFQRQRFFEDLSRLSECVSTSVSPEEEEPEKERLVFFDFSPRFGVLFSLEIAGDRDRSLLARGLRLRVLSREVLAIGIGLAVLALEDLLPPSGATLKAVIVGGVSESESSSEE